MPWGFQATGAMSAPDWLPGFLGTGLPERAALPGSQWPLTCLPFFSVPGGAADVPVHHAGGRHHHGVLGHGRAAGAWRQAPHGRGGRGMLHVLPQLGLAWGRASAGRCQHSQSALSKAWLFAPVAGSGLPWPLPPWRTDPEAPPPQRPSVSARCGGMRNRGALGCGAGKLRARLRAPSFLAVPRPRMCTPLWQWFPVVCQWERGEQVYSWCRRGCTPQGPDPRPCPRSR